MMQRLPVLGCDQPEQQRRRKRAPHTLGLGDEMSVVREYVYSNNLLKHCKQCIVHDNVKRTSTNVGADISLVIFLRRFVKY